MLGASCSHRSWKACTHSLMLIESVSPCGVTEPPKDYSSFPNTQDVCYQYHALISKGTPIFLFQIATSPRLKESHRSAGETNHWRRPIPVHRTVSAPLPSACKRSAIDIDSSRAWVGGASYLLIGIVRGGRRRPRGVAESARLRRPAPRMARGPWAVALRACGGATEPIYLPKESILSSFRYLRFVHELLFVGSIISTLRLACFFLLRHHSRKS
jgi:hypothetical protein